MKKYICGLLACILAFCACSACGTKNTDTKIAKFALPESFNAIENLKIAENDNYTLTWEEEYKKVVLTDKRTGLFWSTTPIDANNNGVDEFGFPIEAAPSVNSPILVKYINPKTRVIEQSIAYTQSIGRGNISFETIDNGVKVIYYFEDEQISIPVDYVLSDTGFSISVDTEKITENENKVYSVALAPFLCSVKNQSTDSYLFVPSGSGAIIKSKEISQAGTVYADSVYGGDKTTQEYTKYTNKLNINLPVYGYKSGGQGGFVIIDSGADHSLISGTVGSTDINYSNIGAEFILRGSDNLQPTKFAKSTQIQTVYSDSISEGKISISFYALSGDDANYNKMASVYKNYLIETSGLTKSDREEVSLHLKFLGATSINKSFLGIPYTSLFTLTTLADVKEIMKEISDSTTSKCSVELDGFGASGLEISKIAGNYSVNSGLGSKKELEDLETGLKADGINLYFNFDIMSYSKSSNSWSFYNDITRGPTGLRSYQYYYYTTIRSRDKSLGKYGFLTRTKLVSSAEKLISKINNWNISGIGIAGLSNTVYADYTDNKYNAGGYMASDVKEIINIYKSKEYNILSNNANDYSACLSSEITDVPLQSSEYDIFDANIPFYQMVFKGYADLTSTPVNLSSEAKESVLKAIESGCGLSYSVINDYDTDIVDSKNKALHSSVYSGIKANIIDTANSLSDFYKQINGAEINSFEMISDSLHKTTFSNGTVVYTNHSDKKATCEFGEIASYGYSYKGGEQ